MATCKDFETGSDHITQLCNLCDSNISDGYCDECRDYMCQSCFDIHSRSRTCRHHVLINDTCQKGNEKAYSEPCTRHPNQSIKFYCVVHKIVGCVECFFPEHRNCHNQNIEDAANIVQDSGEDTRLKREILGNTHSEYTDAETDLPNKSTECHFSTIAKEVKPNGASPAVESQAQNIGIRGADDFDSNTGATDLTWSHENVQELKNTQTLVHVTNIPKDKQRDDLLADLQHITRGKAKLQLAYLERSEGAALIFSNSHDAQKILKTKHSYYQFQSLTKRGLGHFSLCVSDTVWQKLSSNVQAKLIKNLQDAGVAVTDINGQRTITAPTSYQIQLAKCIITDMVTDMDKGYTVSDVIDSVWKTVSVIHKETIKTIETECGKIITFSKEKSQVYFPATNTGRDESIEVLKNAIADMNDKEILDMPVENKEMAKADGACKELESQFGKCCIFDAENKTVYIYTDSFEEMNMYKLQWEFKIGRKKPTTRGNRTKAHVVETSGVDHASSTSPSSIDSYIRIKSSPLENKVFLTAEGIKVMVYKDNILALGVDCIVNAANSHLQHGGGVARAIAKAAGHKFDDECKQYVLKHRLLPVGQACSTTAGKLNYKYVIHTVGPQWHVYDKTPEGKKKCENDLMSAVINSFTEAETKGMKSIAVPAISNEIFGVPFEMCVKQYVRAVQVYSKRNGNSASVLSEIHFIDVKEETVHAMQVGFMEGFSSEPLSRVERNADDLLEKNTNLKSDELPEPLMFESSIHKYEFHFMGNTNDVLLLCKKDIERIKDTNAVVVPVDQSGKCGIIGNTIEAKAKYDTFLQTKKGLFKPTKHVGSIVQNAGYGCGFTFVLYAVYPHSEKSKAKAERETSLANTVNSVLEIADKDDKIQSMVIPMFGIDSREDSEVQLFSSVFVKTYRQFCQEKFTEPHRNPLRVIVVCHEDRVFNVAQCAFVEYTMGMKPSCAGAMAEDTKPFQKNADMPEDKSLEQCLICMVTVTDPKTIQCGHTFCTDCIDQRFEYQNKCPTCGKPCGVITGDQPDGNMTHGVNQNKHLPGFPNYGTICITYNFPHGKQQSCHPSPGRSYKGIAHTAYLPDNEEGRKILKMLRIAFDRKLTFTIGNSMTSGQEDVITWNDIHHKTDPRSNTQFGYPDTTYLERVKDELAAKGVTEEDI